MKAILKVAALLAALSLGACITIPDAPAGAYKVSSAYQVTLGREWSDVTAFVSTQPKVVKVLTIDGPALNRLYLIDGLAPGGFIIKPTKKELPTPTYRAGMTPNELSEFLVDSVVALNYERVEITGLRPAKFGTADALRIDLKGVTKEGLDISGAALVAESGGKLYVILYLAPTEHYFGASLPEVEGIMRAAHAS